VIIDTSGWKWKVDRRLYRLYGLTPDEIHAALRQIHSSCWSWMMSSWA